MTKWYDDSINLNQGTQIAVSSSVYTNDELSLAWIERFDRHSKSFCVGKWRLVLMDGYGSHLTYEFIEYATKNNILLHTFPPHSTHILQPLDVAVFQPSKHYHNKAISQAIRDGATDFNKLDFLGSLRNIRKQTFKTSNILTAFEKTRISPLNPNAVLSNIARHDEQDHETEEDPKAPRTPLRTLLSYDLKNIETPTSVRGMLRHVQELEKTIERH